MKYFIVTTKCGHVGRGNYVVIDFPIIANSRKEAAKTARALPRVKHDWPDAIEYVQQVEHEVYYEQIELNKSDNYLTCKCIQDQRLTCNDLEYRIKSKARAFEYDRFERMRKVSKMLTRRKQMYGY